MPEVGLFYDKHIPKNALTTAWPNTLIYEPEPDGVCLETNS